MSKETELQPLILLEDEPVSGLEDDHLGIEPFARVIAGAAVGTNGPFTIGVFANWGEGKTSQLRQAHALVVECDAEHASDRRLDHRLAAKGEERRAVDDPLVRADSILVAREFPAGGVEGELRRRFLRGNTHGGDEEQEPGDARGAGRR